MYGKISRTEPLLPELSANVEDMHGLLKLDALLDRIRGCVQLRGARVALALPTFVAGYLFPDLYPA